MHKKDKPCKKGVDKSRMIVKSTVKKPVDHQKKNDCEQMNKYEKIVKAKFETVKDMLLDGYGDAAVAEALDISLSSLRRYRNEYPEFGELFTQCRSAADDRVEAALLKRATGYEVDDGKVRHIPPDVRAAVFWLKNRRPESWKERNA